MTHTLAAGGTVQSRWTRLGGVTGEQMLPASRLLGLILGRPDAGKSHLVESGERNFIIKTDLTSTSNRNALAVSWPGFNTQGQVIDHQGKPTTLSFDMVLDTIKTLEDMASKNQDRPETVILDSLTSTMSLMQDWIPSKIPGGKDKKWNELHGQQAWSALYTEFIDIICRIRDAGYGCYVLAHLRKKTDNIGTPQEKTYIAPHISDGFLARLIPYFELIVSMESEFYPDVVKGKTVFKRRVHLGTSIPDLQKDNVYKFRAPVDMIVPEEGSWAAFQAHYLKMIVEHGPSTTVQSSP